MGGSKFWTPRRMLRLRIANVILAVLVALVYLVLLRQATFGIMWLVIALIGVFGVWRWHHRRPTAS